MRRVALFVAAFLLAMVAGRSARAMTWGWYCPTVPRVPCSGGMTCSDGLFWTCTTVASTTSLHGSCVSVSYTWYCTSSFTCPGTSTFGGQACSCYPTGEADC